MRVLLLSMYYTPEPVAKPHELAVELASRGHETMVITSFPNYPSGRISDGYRMRLYQWEEFDGVKILRVPIIINRGHSPMGRIISYLSYSVSAFLFSILFTNRPDIIWTYQIGLPGVLIGFLKRAPHIHEVQDLWPEWGQTPSLGLRGWLYAILDAQERFIYSRASFIVTISDGFRKALIDKRVLPSRILVIPNWANAEHFRPVPRNEQLANREGFSDFFNVIYAGNIGTAQALDVVIEAAKNLTDLSSLKISVYGDGVERSELLEKANGLPNIRFPGSIPQSQMAHYLAFADALLINLAKDSQYEITIPSKTYAYLATGRPILVAATGSVVELVTSRGAGIACAPQDPVSLASAIREIYNMPTWQRDELGAAGRRAFLAEFTRDKLVDHYIELFSRIGRQQEHRHCP